MKSIGFKRYVSEDYPQSPEWFRDFLENLNLTIDVLNPLVANGIDIDNNLTAERQLVSAIHNVACKVTLRTLRQVPRMVRAGYASGHLVTACSITNYGNDGSVYVTLTFADSPTVPVKVYLVLEP